MKNMLLDAARQFVCDAADVSFLTKCRNEMYAVAAHERYVLRLISAERRSREEIEAELRFQAYLFANGASVAQPIASTDGSYCVPVCPDGRACWASVMRRAEGKDWDERDDCHPETLFYIGKALGCIHRLSQSDAVQNRHRRMWYEQEELAIAETVLRRHDMRLHDKFRELMAVLQALPTDEHSFGLTHGDYLLSNYLVHGNDITVIDFDECEYSWYAMDLAICLRCYMLMEPATSLRNWQAKGAAWLQSLLRGYETETLMPAEMLLHLNDLIRVRDFIEIIQYLRLIEDGYRLSETERTRIDRNMERILADIPFLL